MAKLTSQRHKVVYAWCLVACFASAGMASGPSGPIAAPPWRIWSQVASAPSWELDVTVEVPYNTPWTWEAWEVWRDSNNVEHKTQKDSWSPKPTKFQGNYTGKRTRPAAMTKSGGNSSCEGRLLDHATPPTQQDIMNFTW